MKARFSTLAIAVASISSSVTERVQATRSGSPPQHARRILQATDNISEKLKEEHANGIKSAKLLIAAQVDDGEEDAGFGINIPVVEAISSIDADTYFHLGDEGDGSTKSLNDVLGTGKTLADILVTDGSSTDADGSFAVLAVDPEKDEMHGFIEKKGSKPYKVSQAKGVKGGKAVVAEETDQAVLTPRPWDCSVSENFDEESISRRLHGDHDHEHYRHSHDPEVDSIINLESLSKQLRGYGGSVTQIGERRLIDSWESTGSYEFQAEIFFEIDNQFIVNTGGTLETAINYINLLVSTASVIYEKEISTHLRVTGVKVSTIYDSAGNVGTALDIMENSWKGYTWEATHSNYIPSGRIDLHHALLGNDLRGGIAYIGTLCSPVWGFGLTASITGNFNALTRTMMWDIAAFMHEIGHNFGSGHTHDRNSFEPEIDTCGSSCSAYNYGNSTSWASIMSYCHHCSGDEANVYYSFGGSFNGVGDKLDLNNWVQDTTLAANSDGVARTSKDPQRSAHTMYKTAYLKHFHTGCLDVTVEPTPPPVPVPTFSPKPTVVQAPVIMAAFDPTLKVPLCSTPGGACDSGPELLKGHGNTSPPEPNQPNTLDGCPDGESGVYLTDETVESIKVKSLDGGPIGPGREIVIEAKVFTWSSTTDTVDFWYTSDATNPDWKLVNSIKPTKDDSFNTISSNFILPHGTLQAVRVTNRYTGNVQACATSGWDDMDDMAFVVENSCPVYDCFAHCENHFGGKVEYAYSKTNLCAQACAGMDGGEVVDEFKYCLIDPLERQLFCLDQCTYASRQVERQAYCNFGCEFWQDLMSVRGIGVPTPVPTKSLTTAPTHAPTHAPTDSPTSTPTKVPTSTPTKTPTKPPTESPTVTAAPSYTPSSSAPTTGCYVEECFTRCTTQYDGILLDPSGTPYYCAKGCARMGGGEVLDATKFCSVDPASRQGFCMDECQYASSQTYRQNACYFGCEFWEVPPPAPSPAPTSLALAEVCDVDGCFTRCTDRYGGTLFDTEGTSYYCAKGCAGVGNGELLDEMKYCSIGNPVERQSFCINACESAAPQEYRKDACKFGCEFWDVTPAPSSAPSSLCPLKVKECFDYCNSKLSGKVTWAGTKANFCSQGCAEMNGGEAVDIYKYCSMTNTVERQVFCRDECQYVSHRTDQQDYCKIGCDFWEL